MAKVDKKWWIMANLTKIKQKLTKFDEYCKENKIKLATKETLLIFCNLEEDEYNALKDTNLLAFNELKMKIRILENNIKLHLLNETKGGVSVYAQYYGRENETEINYNPPVINITDGRKI
ncbi:hypothetical protein [Spiroplasma endosymbiont of Sarcophaga carnaria]|uniref:hypothetical protein n=1 Tax=Spiroplasma endosymbiont of Sarcophaga carnaria TaxID=3066303 RepID=UPI0030D0527D